MVLRPVADFHVSKYGVLANVQLPPHKVSVWDDIARCFEGGNWLEHNKVVDFGEAISVI